MLFYPKNNDSSNQLLSLLTMYQPKLNNTDCKMSPMSLLTQSGSVVLDHTDSLIHYALSTLMLRCKQNSTRNPVKSASRNWFINLVWNLFTDSFLKNYLFLNPLPIFARLFCYTFNHHKTSQIFFCIHIIHPISSPCN